MSTQPVPRMTAAEYLALERRSEERHEFVRGEIRLMSGATRAHNLVTVNLAGIVRERLRGKPCEAYAVDMRVRVDSDGRYVYPDLSIVCGGPEFEDGQFDTLLNPEAIIEVLSPSTAGYDRSEKFASYRTIPSLREYVLVAQHAPQVEHFVRLDDGAWRFNPVEGLDGEVRLVTADVVLPLAEVYEKVRFDSATT